MNGRESKLSIVTTNNGTESTVEIRGSIKEQLFNLALLTRDVCKSIGVPPVAMGYVLPAIILDYEKTGMQGETVVDVGAIKKGGGTP